MSSNKDWYENIGYEIEVIKESLCRAEHKEGQKFMINSYLTPEGLCMEVFHDIYPLLFAGRINGDFTLLGSDNKNERIYTCPSREIQFKISRFFQCNNCGFRTEKKNLKQIKKKYEHLTLDVLVCSPCYEELIH